MENSLVGKAKEMGVNFVLSSAESIPLNDEGFDLVFSFNVMEHIDRPDLVIEESRRLLVSGGYFFADFDPLYYSARGLHAYRKINIPFCHILFKEADLERYANEHNLQWDDLPYVNKYSADQFRTIWKEMRKGFEILYYNEGYDPIDISMISRYASCFCKTKLPFDNFIISRMTILARKK